MIEVNLFSIPAADQESMVGRLVARSRFDKETMGVSIMEFVKGFLRQNMEQFETRVGNSDLMGFITSDGTMSTLDFSSLNYFLGLAGYTVKIWNVADDEENAVSIPSGDVVEWNVINYNYIQNDYPTVTKIIPGPDNDIPSVLKKIVSESGLFDSAKFSGIVNPFNVLVNNLEHIKSISGQVSSGLTSRIYQQLHICGMDVFCATSED